MSGRRRLVASLLLLAPVVAAWVIAAPAASNVPAGTRAHPHARGAAVVVDGGFRTRILAVDTRAWPAVRKASRSNRPPGPGSTDVLVTLRATNVGETPGLPFVNGSLDAVGNSNLVYSPFTTGCGLIPDDVANLSPVAPGKSVTARACWRVDLSDVRSLLMYYEPFGGGSRVFFALR